MGHVVIGMDPHKRPATIEIIDDRQKVLFAGRFGTDRDGYKAMLAAGRKFSDRTWAVEGCNGIGRHIAQRLVADSEPVVDVPAKLSARARVFSTGQGRKTGPVDAHSVALAGLHSTGLRVITADDATVALRLLADRRDELGVAARRRSTACTGCCWSCSRAGRRSSCPPRRRKNCWPPSACATSPGRPAGWRPN